MADCLRLLTTLSSYFVPEQPYISARYWDLIHPQTDADAVDQKAEADAVKTKILHELEGDK